MMQIHELTALARQMKASDIHISEGLPLMFRIDGRLVNAPVQMSADETRSLILGLMDEAHREAVITERIDADFALVAPDGTRSPSSMSIRASRRSSTSAKSGRMCPALPPPCAALCVRTRTSFWSARCATMRRSPPPLPPPRPATWS